MPYVGPQYSWNWISFSLALAYAPSSFWLTYTYWLYVLISHTFTNTGFRVCLTVFTLSSLYLKYIFTFVFLNLLMLSRTCNMKRIWACYFSMNWRKKEKKITFALPYPPGVKGKPSTRALTLGMTNSFR